MHRNLSKIITIIIISETKLTLPIFSELLLTFLLIHNTVVIQNINFTVKCAELPLYSIRKQVCQFISVVLEQNTYYISKPMRYFRKYNANMFYRC